MKIGGIRLRMTACIFLALSAIFIITFMLPYLNGQENSGNKNIISENTTWYDQFNIWISTSDVQKIPLLDGMTTQVCCSQPVKRLFDGQAF